MAIVVQCPSCGVSSPTADSVSGRKVRCKKCATPFVAQPTLDGGPSETRKTQPATVGDPFPTLPAEFGRYRVLRLLGKGGMGAVYLAKDSQLGREVALKIPFFDAKDSPQRAERFVREARSAAALQHPNICTVFDAGRIAGTPFMTMALIKGTPLDRAIDPDAPMSQQRAAQITRTLALALAHAHEAGIVHRDLKPGNVMLRPDGEPVVMDFGLAKRGTVAEPNEVRRSQDGGASGPQDVKLTRDGGVLGTPSYMSPEQVRGDVDVGPASDVYSLGVLLFEMLTGHTPYTGNLGAVMGKILAAPVPPLAESRPDIDPKLDTICQRAMAKSAADRFPNMAAFAEALGEYLTEDSSVSVELIEPSASPVVVPTPVYRPALAPAADPFDQLTEPAPRKKKPGKRSARNPWIGRGIAAAIAVAVLLPAAWLASYLLRLETPNGTLLVEVNDDEVEARLKAGKLVLSGPDGKEKYTLSPSERNKKLDAGAYTIRVVGADGLALDTTEFTLKKGDKVTVRVTLEKKEIAKVEPKKEGPKPEPAAVDPDRKAAEYVLSVGGNTQIIVQASREEMHIRSVEALPSGRFTLARINLRGNKRVTDDGLAACAGLSDLAHLDLGQTPVTDRGLAFFKDCRLLLTLDLNNAAVSDMSLVLFKNCARLSSLWLGGTRITDQGVVTLSGIKTLTYLDLRDTKITDAGLAAFRDCHQLTMANLMGTGVTDAGLRQFGNCKRLASLHLTNSRVTSTGVADLQAALPKCKIAWDTATKPEPNPAADRLKAVVVGGDWRVEKGELVQTKAGPTTILFGDPAWTDYDFFFETMTDGKAGESAGSGVSLFRATDDNNLYSLLMGGYGGKWTQVNRFEQGRWQRNVPPFQQTYTVNEWHSFHVRARGDRFVCTLDGKKAFDFADAAFPTGRVGLRTWNAPIRFRKVKVTAPDGKVLWDGLPQVGDAKVGPAQVPVAPPPFDVPPKAGDFVPLFNGKDLTGWKQHPDSTGKWTVEDGAIVGRGVDQSHLFTESGEYTDFHIRVEAKINTPGNSGVCFRTNYFGRGRLQGNGYEANIEGDKSRRWQTGSLMHITPQGEVQQQLVNPGEWFVMEVIAVGKQITVKVNGKMTIDLTDPAHTYKRGHIAFQQLGDKTEVHFRKVEIRELTASTGTAVLDSYREKSVWVSDDGKTNNVLTVIERKGDTFRARFEIGLNIVREVSGTVKDGKVSWLAKDVKVIKGAAPGGDNVGTLTRDPDGDRIAFTWRQGQASGNFVLRRQVGK